MTSSDSTSRSRVYRTEAVVLKAYDYGEADRILTLYTPQAGKLRAIAKGVRRTKSRKSGHLDLFTRSNLLVARGRQLDIVTQAETIESFAPMREDLWRSTYTHYVAELIDEFSAENLPNFPLYALTINTLREISTGASLAMAARAFEIQLLSLTGYRPQLHHCVSCRAIIEPIENRFSTRMGGTLCPGCGSQDHAAPRISVAALKVLRNLQSNAQAMLTVRVEESVEREVEARMLEYVTYRLEKRPRSVTFLERLRTEGYAGESRPSTGLSGGVNSAQEPHL